MIDTALVVGKVGIPGILGMTAMGVTTRGSIPAHTRATLTIRNTLNTLNALTALTALTGRPLVIPTQTAAIDGGVIIPSKTGAVNPYHIIQVMAYS